MVCIIHTTSYIDSIQDIYFHRFHREINENTEGVPNFTNPENDILPVIPVNREEKTTIPFNE